MSRDKTKTRKLSKAAKSPKNPTKQLSYPKYEFIGSFIALVSAVLVVTAVLYNMKLEHYLNHQHRRKKSNTTKSFPENSSNNSTDNFIQKLGKISPPQPLYDPEPTSTYDSDLYPYERTKSADGSAVIAYFGSKFKKSGRYAVVAGNMATTNGAAKKMRYVYNIPFTVHGWKNIEFNTLVLLTGNLRDWVTKEPFRTILAELISIEGTVIVIISCWSLEEAGSLAQYGRIFAANYVPLGEEFEDIYLVTGDSDLIPLMEKPFVLEPGVDVLCTNVMMGPSLPLETGFDMDKISGPENVHSYRNFGNESLWIEDVIKQKQYGEEHQEENDSFFLHHSYFSLSSIGASVKTWREIINFSDCQKTTFDFTKIPFKKDVIKNSSSKLGDEFYRLTPLDGCWKNYEKYDNSSKEVVRTPGPQAFSEINKYLSDAIHPDLLTQKNVRGSGKWWIDQKLISLRISQWAKRHGYDKVKSLNKLGRTTKRIGRAPQADTFQRAIDDFRSIILKHGLTEGLKNNTVWSDVHFQPDTHLVASQWWEIYQLFEQLFDKITLGKIVDYRKRFFDSWAKHTDNRQILNLMRDKEQMFNKTGVDPDCEWTENYPVVFTNFSPKSYSREKYDIFRRGDRVFVIPRADRKSLPVACEMAFWEGSYNETVDYAKMECSSV